ncbi:transposase [Acidovorax kalamii]|uniref:transposase n=1 Tax=Acidovorax kalamii TaxID=2004485 RepID=UPI002090524A|nr:transposase [Acidovorax kalamii]MCO5354512.1 transposase [Acidovorax kalamii]
MEWARGIVVSGGELWAEVESTNGATGLVALTELYRRGLPTVDKTVRRTVTVNFRDFSPCDARKYTDYFGIQVTDDVVKFEGHQVFEVQHQGKTYLVPALALMRALFRPTPKLLHEMFGPSALERTLWLDYSNGTADIVVDAKWATSSVQETHSSWYGPLRWMASHPTARRMADSVHRHAMAGHLALDLANCNAEVVLAGVQGPNAVMVTEARILSITPSEHPDLPVVGHEHRIAFLDRDWAKGRNLNKRVSTQVPSHVDGTLELTDDEWSAIAPLLAGARKRAYSYELCQRSLFDGVLRKLATGETWRKSTYKVGDWRNAATAHRTWTRRGTFQQALEVLQDMRGFITQVSSGL